MSVWDLIAAVAVIAFFLSGLLMLLGVILVEWILMPLHRRRTGRELIEPIPPLPGQAAGMIGLCLISPRFHRRSRHLLTIDKAPRIWRWISMTTAWACLVMFICGILSFILMPERYW